MARTVEEIMNRELLSVPQDASAGLAREALLSFGVTTLPVLDADRRPLGVVALRDVLEGGPVSERMKAPVATIAPSATLDEAGRRLDTMGYHHLVVTDADGRAVGMVSALDVMRGLLGLPVRRPTFPRFDPEPGVLWTDDTTLRPDLTVVAPDGPGVLVLVRGDAGVPERVVWAEGCANVRTRLDELLAGAATDEPLLERLLAQGHLRFRAAVVTDPATRARVVERIRGALGHLPPPQSKLVVESAET